MEASTNLGRVSLVPRGEYRPESQYKRLDIVGYGGSSYLVLHDLQGVTPTDGTDYMLLAARGQDGEGGTPGSSIASIERTEGTGAPGTVDTYTITLTDGSTTTFQVYNGADGNGTGDMASSVYDPQGKGQDIFQYVDDALEGFEGSEEALQIAQEAKDTAQAAAQDAAQAKTDAQSAAAAASTAQAAADAAQTAADTALTTMQPKLTGQPGQVVGFDGMGFAYAIRGWSNRNLLDNWYFVDPINQRGKTEYTGEGYTIDRWRHDADTCTLKITSDGILFSGQYDSRCHYYSQYIDIPPELLYGKTITGSMIVDGQLFYGTIIAKYQYDVWESQVFHENGEFGFYFQMTDSGYFRFLLIYNQDAVENGTLFQAAKAEFGSQQTLAHQDADGNWVLNDPPPDKTLELLKCQRYYRVFSEQSRRPTKAMDFCPPMRINPTLGTIKVDGVTYYTADANL